MVLQQSANNPAFPAQNPSSAGTDSLIKPNKASVEQLQLESISELKKTAQDTIAKLVLPFAEGSNTQKNVALKKSANDLVAIYKSLENNQPLEGKSINLNDRNVLNNIIKRSESFGKEILLDKINSEIWGKVSSNGLREWSQFSDLANKCNSTIATLSGKAVKDSEEPAFDLSTADLIVDAINQVSDFGSTIKAAQQAKQLYQKDVMLNLKVRTLAEQNPALSEKLASLDALFGPSATRSEVTPSVETFKNAYSDLQSLVSNAHQNKLTYEEQKLLVVAYKTKLTTTSVADNADLDSEMIASVDPNASHGPSIQEKQVPTNTLDNQVTISDELKKLLLQKIDRFLTVGDGTISKEEVLSMQPTELMNEYADAVVRCAKAINPDLIGSLSECAGPVRRGLGVVGITDGQRAIVGYDKNGNPIRSGSARKYPEYFDNGMFKDNFAEVTDVPQKQPELSEFLKQLPKGVIVSYLDSKRPKWHGHIQVSLGNGNFVSDFKHDELVYNSVTNVRVFVPVGSTKYK